MSRTRLSVVRLVQGLYPELPLTAVRAMTEVREERDEDLYPMYKYCDRLREIFDASAQNPLFRHFMDTPHLTTLHGQALAILAGPGFDPKSKGAQNRSWIAMSDAIKCRQAEGLPYRPGVTPGLAAHINRAAEFLFHSLLKGGEHSTEQRTAEEQRMLNDRSSLYNENLRLGIGRFITELLPSFHAALRPSSSSPRPPPRLLVFGGHDSSMVSILAALGLDAALEGKWPPFASYLVLELLEERGRGERERLVRSVYNGKELEVIPFAEFERRVENMRVNDWAKECKAHSKGPVPPQVW